MAQPRGGGASALEHVSHVLACLVHRHSFFEDEEPPQGACDTTTHPPGECVDC